jgi:predicted CopG family antitoxin
MTSKTISIKEEVYNLLKSMKLPHESFDEVILRLCKNYTAKNLLKWLDSTDAWEDMSKEDFIEFNRAIKKFQNEFKPFSTDYDDISR